MKLLEEVERVERRRLKDGRCVKMSERVSDNDDAILMALEERD